MHRTAVFFETGGTPVRTMCGKSTRNRSSPRVCAGADVGTEAAPELRPPPRRPFIKRISNKACDICFGAVATRLSATGSLDCSTACLGVTAPVLARRRFFLASLGMAQRSLGATVPNKGGKKPAYFVFFHKVVEKQSRPTRERARARAAWRDARQPNDVPRLLQNV